MSFKIQFLLCFLLFSVIADAFNITAILGQYPTYSTFNSYLTQTLVAGSINSRSSLTVLAVSNDNIGALSGKSGDDLMAIMSVHVVLDYYDMKKLQNMANQNVTLTTLYQASGKAKGQQGFLVAIVSSSGDVSFASAVAGSSNVGAKLVGSVASQPYNISVLQVSGVIVPPGIAGTPATNSTASNSTTAPSSPPTATATNSSTAPSSPPSSTPTSSSPVSAPSPRTSTTPTPASAPKTSPTKSPLSPPAPTPTTASSPKSSNSTAAPAPSTGDAPAASTVEAPAPSTDPSTSTETPTLSPDTAADSAPSLGTSLRLNLGAMSVVVLPTVCLMAMF